MSILTRKKFITTLAGVSALLTIPQSLISQFKPAAQEKGPQLDKEWVKNFVGFAHKDPEKVKAMLQETPDLLNAVHNLGGWDWEDAIGAAGHVGIPDLTLFLIEQGARPTICVAAMMGKLEVVQSYINAFPAMKYAVGPHKISLMRHAKAGGEAAMPVYDYLLGLGLKE